MMKFAYSETSLVDKKEIERESETLFTYMTYLSKEVLREVNYAFPESSLHLPSDKDLMGRIEKLVHAKLSRSCKYHFLIGIGGSNLGARALYEAAFLHHDLYQRESYPKTFFLDAVDAGAWEELRAFVEREIHTPDEFLVSLVTKSGTTTETVVNAELLFNILREKFDETAYAERVVAITDKGSPLDKVARDMNMDVLEVPKMVGGRFSVFSAAGMFPLMVSGVDVAALRRSAVRMRERCLLARAEENPALISAVILFMHSRGGKNIHDTFLFTPGLESVGKWYRQLMAESLGKEENRKGSEVRAGMTPTVSIGSTDLHSMAQLYLGGPKDKVTTFVRMGRRSDAHLPRKTTLGLVKNISGKSVREVTEAIYEGTKTAYKKDTNPFTEIVLENFADIGAFMQCKMMEIMYLGYMMGINTFDQPAVEKYKEVTRKLLEP